MNYDIQGINKTQTMFAFAMKHRGKIRYVVTYPIFWFSMS